MYTAPTSLIIWNLIRKHAQTKRLLTAVQATYTFVPTLLHLCLGQGTAMTCDGAGAAGFSKSEGLREPGDGVLMKDYERDPVEYPYV